MISSSTLERKTLRQIASGLSKLLADTYLLYVKTQNFHWNVVDSKFYSLHKFFESQYEALSEAVDEIAERIRALGEKAPGSMKEFLDLTQLDESPSELSGSEMIQTLAEDHHLIIDWLRPEIELAAKRGDEGTADLFIQRLRFHEKTLWMLRSHFPEE